MCSSVYNWMEFTVDTEDDHENRRIPMLDICTWREGKHKVKHAFYEKDVSSKLVVMSKSATPQGNKISSLSQEVIRRQRNTGRSIGPQERINEMNKFMVKMYMSGYNQNEREDVMRSGLTGYERMVVRELK